MPVSARWTVKDILFHFIVADYCNQFTILPDMKSGREAELMTASTS